MKAIEFTAVDRYELVEVPEPVITDPYEVKVRIMATGICASDILGLKGKHMTRKPPVISGHESAGIVTETGSAVTQVRPGDQVVIEPHYGCGKCYACLQGKYNICRNKKVLGTITHQGSFAEYVVMPEKCMVKMLEGMSFPMGALVEPLSVGVHSSRRAEITPADTVAVIGGGAIGLSCMLGARIRGAKRVFVADISEYALKKAAELGADCVIDSGKEDLVKRIMELTDNEGVDVAFGAVTYPEVLNDAVKITKLGGRTMAVATFGLNNPNFQYDPFRYKEIDIRGCVMYTREDFEVCVENIASGVISPEPMITRVYPLSEYNEAFQHVLNNPGKFTRIIIDFS